MLGLARSLADLTLQTSVRKLPSQCLHTGITGSTNSSSGFMRTGTSGLTGTAAFLLPTSLSHMSKRTWFKPMDEYGRGETAADGYGVTLYSPKDGERTGLKAVEMRFKRLNWGMWIRTRSGRDKKQWKMDTHRLRLSSKHFFCVPYHCRRFDRAVLSHVKEIRHIPDDPYKTYNNLSYQNYHSVRVRNSERVKKYGPNIYKFPWYRAHFKKDVIDTDKDNTFWYEPPGYHKDLEDGDGIYTPDPSRPQNIPGPHYMLQERGASKVHQLMEKRFFREIRRCEPYYGYISPTHILRLPVYGTHTG